MDVDPQKLPVIEPVDLTALSEASKASGGDDMAASDAEAYAKLKARRAERRKKKLIKRGIIAGVIVLVLAAGTGAVYMLTRPVEQQQAPITDVVSRGTFANEVDAKGTLEALSSTVVTPEVDGTIAELKVAAGQQVQAGDVLFTIKNDELDRAVAEAERSYRGAQADLETANRSQTQASSSLAEARKAQQAAVQLSSSDNPEEPAAAQPVVDVSSAAAEVENAKSAVAAAQRSVESAQAALDAARATAAKRTVQAPSSGSIVAMNAQVGAAVGQAAGADASKPLIQIADLSQMKVTVKVGEEDVAKVAKDQSTSITFPAFPDLTLNGTVTGIASIASADGQNYSSDGSATPTFDVDVLIPEPDPRLKPGMTAEVQMVTKQLDDVVMVPISALLTDDGTSYYVNVVTDQESMAAEQRPVNVVEKNEDFAVVGKPSDAAEGANGDLAEAPVQEGDLLLISGGTVGDGSAYGEPGTGSYDVMPIERES